MDSRALQPSKHSQTRLHLHGVEITLAHHLIIKIIFDILILSHLQPINHNQTHRSFYHLSILVMILIRTNIRIQTLIHIHQYRIHILSQIFMYPNAAPTIDLHLVIILIFLLDHDPVHNHFRFPSSIAYTISPSSFIYRNN